MFKAGVVMCVYFSCYIYIFNRNTPKDAEGEKSWVYYNTMQKCWCYHVHPS